MFILAGGAALLWSRERKLFAFLVTFLMALFVMESALTRPNYLSYFNSLAGGNRNAHRHLVDSSLDWGQDLPALKDWLKNNRVQTVYLSYFGTADPDYYGVHAITLPGFPDSEEVMKDRMMLRPGVYCISATMLHSVYNIAIGPWNVVYESQYRKLLADTSLTQPQVRLLNHFQLARLCALLRKREPDDYAGDSIFIYRVNEDELNRGLYGQPAEMYPGIMVSGISRFH
jgi:hypothetical protein